MKTSDILFDQWKALGPSKTNEEGVRALTLYEAYAAALGNEAEHGWQDALTADVKEYTPYFVRDTIDDEAYPGIMMLEKGTRFWYNWACPSLITPLQVYINQEDINAHETE